MKADVPTPIRKKFIVSGYVQEAGYRLKVKAIANKLGIFGFVRNLPDETVEIVCESDPGRLAQFIKAINIKGNPESAMDINVASMVEAPAPAEGVFTAFRIEYDGKLSPEERDRARELREERMILGASILGEKIDGVGQKVDSVGQKVDGVGQKVDGVGQKVDGVGQKVDVVGQKVDSVGQKVDVVGQKVDGVGKAVKEMHSDVRTRFDHMADRYDMIAISLREAIAHMDRNAEKTDRAIEKSRKESAMEALRTRKEIAKSRKETVMAIKASEERTAKYIAKTSRETALEARKSQKETAQILSETRKEVAASNRELAGAVKFMIRKLSDKPARKKLAGKRKR
jgi:acylphosphatase/uncharacterized protein YoxC